MTLIQMGTHQGKSYAMASNDVEFEPQHDLVEWHSMLSEWEDARFWACLATKSRSEVVDQGIWVPRIDHQNALILFKKTILGQRMGKTQQAMTELYEVIEFGSSIGLAPGM